MAQSLAASDIHLRTFATSLLEGGYRDSAMRSKLRLLTDFGRWLERTERAVTHEWSRLG
jgi:hypothetical protein